MSNDHTLLNPNQALTLTAALRHIADTIDTHKASDPLAHEGFDGDGQLLNGMTIPEWLRQEAGKLPDETVEARQQELEDALLRFVDPDPCVYSSTYCETHDDCEIGKDGLCPHDQAKKLLGLTDQQLAAEAEAENLLATIYEVVADRTPQPTYSGIQIKLVGEDADPHLIMFRVVEALRASGVDTATIKEFIDQATMDGTSLDNVVRTVFQWVTVKGF